jgi:hypothetical protein
MEVIMTRKSASFQFVAQKSAPVQISLNFGPEQLVLSQLSTNCLLRHWQLILMRDYERKRVMAGLLQAEKHDTDYTYQTVQGSWIVKFSGRTATNRRSWDVYFRCQGYGAA